MGPLDLIRAHLLWLEAGSPVQTLQWRTRRRDRQRGMTTLESHSGEDWLSTSLAWYKCMHAPQHWVAICSTSAQPQKYFALLLSWDCCKNRNYEPNHFVSLQSIWALWWTITTHCRSAFIIVEYGAATPCGCFPWKLCFSRKHEQSTFRPQFSATSSTQCNVDDQTNGNKDTKSVVTDLEKYVTVLPLQTHFFVRNHFGGHLTLNMHGWQHRKGWHKGQQPLPGPSLKQMLCSRSVLWERLHCLTSLVRVTCLLKNALF